MNTPLNHALPCPFCSSTDISDGEVLMSTPNGGTSTQSMCRGCGALGPEAKLPKDEVDYGDVRSIAAWNTRANALESSAAQSAMTGEPDAWRYRYNKSKNSKKWLFTDDKMWAMELIAQGSWDVEPMRISQPSDATAQPSDEQIKQALYKELDCEGGWPLYEVTAGNVISVVRALLANTAQGKPEQCPTCRGNDADAPCAYPSCGMTDCLRDKRLAAKKG